MPEPGSSYSNRLRNGSHNLKKDLRLARQAYGRNLTSRSVDSLGLLSRDFDLSFSKGELQLINGSWYVTHSGLIRLARRKKCRGISVETVSALCDSAANRFVMKATVYPCRSSVGFVGYGDADPSNISPLVLGAEIRVAETRAVNRALRKAYGIGTCSVEEIGLFAGQVGVPTESKKCPQPTNRNGTGIVGGRTVRDRLCQVIRQHQLDPNLVKAYAIDSCGVKTLREATRDQVENFVKQLADWAEKDRNALLCQLNSYARPSQKEQIA